MELDPNAEREFQIRAHINRDFNDIWCPFPMTCYRRAMTNVLEAQHLSSVVLRVG